MGVLLIVAALAQVGSAGGSTAPGSTGAKAPEVHPGQSTYVDLEAAAGYSTNPNLSFINDRGGGYGRASIHLVHSRVSALSSTLLSAYAENVSYTNDLGSQQSANLFGRHDAAVSEHVRLFVDGSASYEESGQLGTRLIGLPTVPAPGGTVTPPILNVPLSDFLSVTGRRYSFAGHGGGTFALGPRDSMTFSSGAEHAVFHSGATRTSYTTIPVSVAYDRRLTERTTVGARVTGSRTDYNGPASVRVVTPQFTTRTLLSPGLTLEGAVGVSFARTDTGVTVRHSTGLSAQASLCGQG